MMKNRLKVEFCTLEISILKSEVLLTRMRAKIGRSTKKKYGMLTYTEKIMILTVVHALRVMTPQRRASLRASDG